MTPLFKDNFHNAGSIVPCAKILLKAGADPNSRSRSGKALDQYAVTRKFPKYLGVTWEELVETNKHKVPTEAENENHELIQIFTAPESQTQRLTGLTGVTDDPSIMEVDN